MGLGAFLLKRKYEKAVKEKDFNKFMQRYSGLLRSMLNVEFNKLERHYPELATSDADRLVLDLSHIMLRAFRDFYKPNLEEYEFLNKTMDTDTIDNVRTLTYIRDLFNLKDTTYDYEDVRFESSRYYDMLFDSLKDDPAFKLTVALFTKYQSLYVTATLGIDEFKLFEKRVGIKRSCFNRKMCV